MSNRHDTTSHAVVFKGLRVFSVQFFCDECNGQFIDDMITVGPRPCPCCDMDCQPDGIEEYEIETNEEDE